MKLVVGQLDYWTLVIATAGVLFAATLWLRSRRATGMPIVTAWVVSTAILGAGFFALHAAGENELCELRAMLEGFAPTYAAEMAQLGHAHVDLDAPADDPTYLAIVAAQKRWLSANPAVADIYTIRRRPDGKFALLADSETDYDRDGAIDEEREERTEIGEVYEDDDEGLSIAWSGRPYFSPEPVTDRWGTWVSAYVPMRSEGGQVEAICGVDYPVDTMAPRIAAARRGVIGWLAGLLVALNGAMVTLSLMRGHVRELRMQVAERELAAAALAEAKEQADAANVAKSTFLANMSHELRTPLTAVLGFADLLRDADAAPAERREWSNVIHRNGEHLLHVINEILDLSKIEAGRLALEPQPASAAAMVEEVVELMRVRASAKGLSLRLAADPKLPPRAMLDPTRLRQILINLVGNAVKFTASGSVTITVRYDAAAATTGPTGGGMLTVEVVDTGIGMSDDVLRRLFRPFEQGDVSTTRQFGGTGLGLTISRRLALMMSGDITVASRLGHGSVFTLRLPITPADADRQASGPSTHPPLAA